MQEKTLLKQKIRTSNIHSMDFGSVSYDIFGSPYQKSGSFLADDSLDFGYLGKPYNSDTELYDYGFRDYSPEIARFTTVDPIRDGRNWYCYVVNDPVNFVDLWGLCGSDGEKNIYNVTLLGGDVKLLIGGGINFGVAWDEEEHFAITTTLSVGFGVEASVDTPLTISYSKIENKNLSDLKGFGPYKFSTDKSANAGMFIGGFSYDFEEQKITGYDILSVGGGVDASLTIYFDFQEATKIINNLSAEAKEYVYTALENTSFPEKIQPYVDELLKRF